MNVRNEDTDAADDRFLNESWAQPLRIGFYLALALLIFLLVLTFVVEPWVKHRIEESVHESSQETYLLEIDDLNINLFGGGLSLSDVVLRPDSSTFGQERLWQQVPGRGTLTTDRATVGGISYTGWFFRNELDISSIVIESPKVELTPTPQPEESADTVSRTPSEMLYRMVSSKVDSARLDRFEIRNADIALRNTGGTHVVFSLQNASLTLRDIVADSARAADSTLFITDRIEWRSRSFAWNMDNGLYRMTGDSIGVSAEDSSFTVRDLQLIPLYPRYEFALEKGVQTDRIDLEVPELQGSGIDFRALIHESVFRATSLSIEGAEADIYRDKRPESGPEIEKELIHRKLDDLPIDLDIDSLQITGTSIHYSERQPQAPSAGTIRFEKLNAHLTNLRSSMQDTLRLQAETMVMDEGLLQVEMLFPLQENFLTVEGTLGPMPITAFNPMLAAVAFIEASTGQLHGIEFSMELGDTLSTGTMTMDYEDFAIEVLDKESLEQSAFEDIKTFLANTFVVKRYNHDPAEPAEINFERIRHKSIFNYWWKSLLSGIKETIGL